MSLAQPVPWLVNWLQTECAHNLCWGKDIFASGPLLPDGVDLDGNISRAENFKGNVAQRLSWFYNQVKNQGPWDYKQLGRNYENFGNFHYGAVGAALGLPDQILLRGAGFAQQMAGTSDSSWGSFFGFRSPYGDDPKDQKWIKQGIDYYRAMEKKKDSK